jgi:hypothetical protein
MLPKVFGRVKPSELYSRPLIGFGGVGGAVDLSQTIDCDVRVDFRGVETGFFFNCHFHHFKVSLGRTKKYHLYGQKDRTQKDTRLIFLRSMFLPNQDFCSLTRNKLWEATGQTTRRFRYGLGCDSVLSE